ncbi:MAG: hypothetical protein Metus_1427 [Candidatus Methanosuratincola subterraneus]|uniref:Uncharacterized protein n=1 Tax=Methanosuratincola subterraneus TaxID=2593994 RepID=A0A3S3TS09_METS7|nr:MAG: hypothetical protein Metus_1427 [Candidatus Methanosuratincola subterraneus]
MIVLSLMNSAFLHQKYIGFLMDITKKNLYLYKGMKQEIN